MASSFSAVWDQAGVDGKTALMNGGRFDVMDGAQPASVATAITTQTVLVSLPFAAQAMTAATGSPPSAGLNGTPSATAVGNGNATWARAYTAGGTALFDVSVSGIGGGGEAELSDTSIALGQVINLVTLNYSVTPV